MWGDPPKNRRDSDPARVRGLPRQRCSALRLRNFETRSTPLELFARLRRGSHPWLLDSALPSPRLGRFSFFGADPHRVLRVRGSRIDLECRRAVVPGEVTGRRVLAGDPFEALRALLSPRPESPAGDFPRFVGDFPRFVGDFPRFVGDFPRFVGDTPPFVGGAVGYLGYELAEHLEPLELGGRDDLDLPDLVMLCVDRVVAFDHARGRFTLCGLGFGDDPATSVQRAEAAVDALATDLRQTEDADAVAPGGANPAARIAHDVDAGSYAKAVDEAKQEIAAGNVYQACLTHRMERRWSRDPWQLYLRLRRTNPAPFASYLELPEVTIAGSSPERFLSIDADGRAESRPIKGTRPRGRTPAEDELLRRDLAASPKDRAENLMIVDLVRNDLGRVCETGSVAVPELMAIEEYASVFQMVSTVRGRLRGDRDAIDLVRATFPPGSMTGAPKIAAMRILDRLEPVRRGVYSGAIGYLDARGGADLSVAIRTILLRDGRALVHSGGGIVADSDPADEYRESLDKVGPLLAALDDD